MCICDVHYIYASMSASAIAADIYVYAYDIWHTAYTMYTYILDLNMENVGKWKKHLRISIFAG